MTAPTANSRVLRFGTFELDLAAGELRKSGRKVRVQEQPFQCSRRWSRSREKSLLGRS